MRKQNDGTDGAAAPVVHWRKLKFGLMMHWGLYSVAGGVWADKNIPGYNEQIKHRAKMSWPEYLSLCAGFTAENWHAEAIAELAKDAGMRYVVLTAKHHDGFNLWHTQLSDFNAVDAAAAGQDVIKPLAAACACQDLDFGLYYSLIDWHYPGAAAMSDHNSDPITPALEAYTLGQLRELLVGYGPLCEIWFDMGTPTLAQSQKFADIVHALQPDCMVSGRIWNDREDFMECGDNEVPEIWMEGPWESASTIFHETWGYRSWQRRDDLEGKIREKVHELAMVVARGGNYLLNIGPRGDGSIVDFDAAVLRGIGGWVRENEVAIYDSEPEPHLQLNFGYATRHNRSLYLFISKPPSGNILRIDRWQAPLPEAFSKGIKLECTIDNDKLSIKFPQSVIDPYLTVVTVAFATDQPYVPANAILPTPAGTTQLSLSAALPRHRLSGSDYSSLRKFVAALEWFVWPTVGGDWQVRARRPQGGPTAAYLLTIGTEQKQFILPESIDVQEYACPPITLQAMQALTIKLQDIDPRSELASQGLIMELIPV